MILGNNGFIRRRLPAAASWWLAGGILAANAIGVYQAIGAVDIDASYTNLANPGVNDAAPGVAPTWASGTGWTGTGTQWLNTGIVPSSADWTYIVRFSGMAEGIYDLFGINDTTNNARANIRPTNSSQTSYRHGDSTTRTVSGVTTSGVLAIAGKNAYKNGVSDGTIGGGGFGSATALPVYLMAMNQTSIGANTIMVGSIQAVAIYDTTLTADQVASVTDAMNLL